jgi:hypothetical protein
MKAELKKSRTWERRRCWRRPSPSQGKQRKGGTHKVNPGKAGTNADALSISLLYSLRVFDRFGLLQNPLHDYLRKFS